MHSGRAKINGEASKKTTSSASVKAGGDDPSWLRSGVEDKDKKKSSTKDKSKAKKDDTPRCCGIPFGPKTRAAIVAAIVVTIFVLEFVNMSRKHRLNPSVAIFPRKGSDFVRILTFIFFHGSLLHLVFNVLWCAPMGYLLMDKGPILIPGLILQWLLSGLLIWGAGLKYKHVGLDPITAGMATYCILSGFKRKQYLAIALGVGCYVVAAIVLLAAKQHFKGLQWDSLLAGVIVAALQFAARVMSVKFCVKHFGDNVKKNSLRENLV
eukprot:c6865_g1_i1.p1 GENE.c6865_g1_i1~~c6865_g1_i1.p1  ORF type:complete len:266 (-),score=52.79 c6865_g1_i1:130-927(-)